MTWVTENKLIATASLPQTVSDMVVSLIAGAKNGIVSGDQGSGKTTVVKTLLDTIPEQDRVLVIEQPVKLKTLRSNTIKMPPSSRPLDRSTTQEILAVAQAHQPEHTIVGSIRDRRDYQLLLILNAQHGGTLSTVHATSATRALDYLRDLAMNAQLASSCDCVGSEVAETIDFVLHCESDHLGRKRISELLIVDGYNHSTESFETTTLYRAEYREPCFA